jgi:hypothetical protein
MIGEGKNKVHAEFEGAEKIEWYTITEEKN